MLRTEPGQVPSIAEPSLQPFVGMLHKQFGVSKLTSSQTKTAGSVKNLDVIFIGLEAMEQTEIFQL